MTIAELIDGLTALPNKDRDVAIHIRGALSGILDIAGVDDTDGEGGTGVWTVYLDTIETEAKYV